MSWPASSRRQHISRHGTDHAGKPKSVSATRKDFNYMSHLPIRNDIKCKSFLCMIQQIQQEGYFADASVENRISQNLNGSKSPMEN